jgi:ADP-ribose pyrophosphatase YjhB (NUDIX family)
MTSAGPRVRMIAAAVFRTGAGGMDELLVIDRAGAAAQLPAGPVEDGEATDDAALRAVLQQTGLQADLRTLISTVDEVVGGEQRRRWIYILDAEEGGPAEWMHAGARCRWSRLDAVELDDAHQPWLDLVRADLP